MEASKRPAPPRSAAARPAPRRRPPPPAAPCEAFLAEGLPDGALLAPPPGGPFTKLTLFVCTYVAKLAHLHIEFTELTRLLCERPHGCLLAINSNFGHACQPGHEDLLKRPRPPAPRRVPSRSRPRKVQGDGTCFNSAVEPVIAIPHPGTPPGKVYMVKCFPTTGETQVPGVVCPDLSDGHAVLAALVDYLNALGVGDPVGVPLRPRPAAPPKSRARPRHGGWPPAGPAALPAGVSEGPAGETLGAPLGSEGLRQDETLAPRPDPRPGPAAAGALPFPVDETLALRLAGGAPGVLRHRVAIACEQPKMLNYKFRLRRNSPRILVNLRGLAEYLGVLERVQAHHEAPLTPPQRASFGVWPAVVLPPFPVRETKPPTDDVKVSFRFRGGARAPRINVFQEGKVNILGAESADSAEQIYAFFVRLFSENWEALVCLQPLRDADRRRAALRAELGLAAGAAPRGAAAEEKGGPTHSGLPRGGPLVSTAEMEAFLEELLEEEPWGRRGSSGRPPDGQVAVQPEERGPASAAGDTQPLEVTALEASAARELEAAALAALEAAAEWE